MNSSYSSQFKQDAVKLAVESDQSIANTARDLGVNANTLYTWVTRFHQSVTSTAKGTADNNPYDELKRLRREVSLLKEERNILKKAAAYFAKNSL